MKGGVTVAPYNPSFALLPGLGNSRGTGGGRGGEEGVREREEGGRGGVVREGEKLCTLDLWNLEGLDVKVVEEEEVGEGSGLVVEEEEVLSVPTVVVDEGESLF